MWHECQRRSCFTAGEPFALVLTDHMMPEMDGFMLAGEIRCHPELVGSMLMMLSSCDRRESIHRCRELGVEAFITKPVRRAELINALAAVLNSSDGRSHNPHALRQPISNLFSV